MESIGYLAWHLAWKSMSSRGGYLAWPCKQVLEIGYLELYSRTLRLSEFKSPLRKEPLVCRFHPLLKSILNRALKCVPPPLATGFRILPGWKNTLPSLATRLAKAGEKCREGWREGNLCVSDSHRLPLQYYTCNSMS